MEKTKLTKKSSIMQYFEEELETKVMDRKH